MLGKLKPTVIKLPGQCNAAGKLWSKDSPQVSPVPGQCSDNHSTEHPATEKETEPLRTSINQTTGKQLGTEESPQDEKSEALSVSPIFWNQLAM